MLPEIAATRETVHPPVQTSEPVSLRGNDIQVNAFALVVFSRSEIVDVVLKPEVWSSIARLQKSTMPFWGSSGAPLYGGVAADPPGTTGTIRDAVPFEMTTHNTMPAVAPELVFVPLLDVTTDTLVASEHSTDAVISSATVLLVLMPPLRRLTQTLPLVRPAGHGTDALPAGWVQAALATLAVHTINAVEPSTTILFAAVAPAGFGCAAIPAAQRAAAANPAHALRIIRISSI